MKSFEPFYEVREFNNIREMIDQSAELFGDRPAFEVKKNDEHFEITYKEYYEKINGFATALLDAGYSNTGISICADNCYEYCLSYIAAICSGNVIVPIDKELAQEDILNIAKVSKSEVFICDEKLLSRINVEEFTGMRFFCIDKSEDCEFDVESFDDFVNSGIEMNKQGKKLYLDVEHDINKLCTLLFTSGTTGISKGVMLCQKNFMFEIKSALSVVKIYPEDCGISLLPLHHTFESAIMVFFAAFCGARVTFCEGFKYVLRNMKEFTPSVFVAVPLILETVHKRIMKNVQEKKNGMTLFNAGKLICRTGRKVGLNLSKIVFKEIHEQFGNNMRMIICGGAPIDPQIVQDFEDFGFKILVGYGLTECAPLCMMNHDRLRTNDSVGQPIPGSEAKLINVDENGIGEICVRGGMVMLGYYENQEATDEVLDKDGFFHTGDLGYIDKRGCYHLTGRCKNVIVTSNGKNIYPEELEYHLNKSNFVASCMVEGVEDKNGNLQVHAQIFPDKAEIKEFLDKDPSDEEIKVILKGVVNRVNDNVPGFKRIKDFLIRDEDFEMTTSRKIKRNENTINKRKISRN